MDANKQLYALITGAAGFLGRHIAAEFVKDGWSVVGLDQCAPPQEGSEFEAWCRTTLPSSALDDLLTRYPVQVLVHAAGPASVPNSVANPSTDFQNSVPVFFHTLDAVRRHAPECRVVFLSSAAVYGNPTQLPVNENAPVRPVSPYGFHKFLCEEIAREFYDLYQLRACVLRIFSAYGPTLRRQVLWDICQKAIHQPVIELLGTGNETRDFVHAQDIARAILLVLNVGAFDGQVYNLATGKETSIRELAEILRSALSVSKEIRFTGRLRKGDPIRWRANTARLAALGYQPEITMDEGATRYARWVLEEEKRTTG